LEFADILNNTTNKGLPALLTAPEVARILGVSVITLLRMRQAKECGGLPFIQISTNRIGYSRRDVLKFLKGRRVTAPANAEPKGDPANAGLVTAQAQP
jgi:hypothetical protein